MDLNARDVHEKQFNDAWRGYNQEEVDDFLDRVADAIEQLHRENASLRQRIAELDQAVSASRNTEEMLKKTLVSAQRAAEEAISTAKAKAERLINEAEARATRAAEETDRRSAEAERSYALRRQQLDASIDRLKAFETDMKRRLRAFLEGQQRALETLDARPRSEEAQSPAADTRPQPVLRATPSPRSDTPDEADGEREEAQSGGQVRAFTWRPDKAR